MTDGGRFAGRNVLVTGSTGLAASAARAIASEGGSVFVVSRSEDHAAELAAGIERSKVRGGTGGSWICFIATVTGRSPSKGTRPVSIS